MHDFVFFKRVKVIIEEELEWQTAVLYLAAEVYLYVFE